VSDSVTIITTDRVVLRPIEESDRQARIALFTSPEVRRFVGGAKTPAEAEAATAVHGEPWWGYFVICDRVSDEVIGTLSFARKTGDWEVSFQLAKAHWGQGLATEALSAALGWFFDGTAEPSVLAFTQQVNERSIRLLERVGGVVTAEVDYKGISNFEFTIARP
jgi:RimJ/RimL family protein N-acetyltransferase